MEQFQNDFLAKLKSSIDQVHDQVRNLNRALRQAQFGTDSYQFRVERNPDYAEYYDMIMAPELMEDGKGLFALPFQDKYGRLYRVNDTSSFGNTVRLVVFDEAFNKMDSDRIIESVRLLRKMGLQAIICTPPDKVADIMPIADRTLLVNKDKYRMHILPFGKEIAQ